jgi:hypothetical protein
MKTVRFEVKAPDAAMGRVVREARAGEYDGRARITFPSARSMARVLAPTRWTIAQTLTGAGPLGVHEIARRAGRDVKGVHTDLSALVSPASSTAQATVNTCFPSTRSRCGSSCMPPREPRGPGPAKQTWVHIRTFEPAVLQC